MDAAATMAAARQNDYCLQLLDCDCHIHGMLSSSLVPLLEKGHRSEYSDLKILEFSLCQLSDDISCSIPGIHVMRATIVSSNPGLQFSDPV